MTGILLLVTGPAADALETEPRPPRAPRPWVGAEPWDGFRLPDHGMPFAPPLSAAADHLRWTGWLAAAAAAPRPAPRPVPVVLPPVADPTDYLDRESPEFRRGWARARAAAQGDDLRAMNAALTGLTARTPTGAANLRGLSFAAAILAEDRSAADSLFYRLSWDDGGRTAGRLAAWRALERGEGARVAAALEGMPDREPGERVALAFARWMAEPRRADPHLPAGEFSPLAARGAALVQARSALVNGDLPGARHALAPLHDDLFPSEWAAVRDALAGMAAEGAAAAGDADARSYGEAARAFLAGDDESATAELDRWLSAWPESPYRPQAYLLRGHLRLAAGRLEEAEDDLAVAESRDTGELAQRAALARVFILMRRGSSAEALARFDRILAGPLGATAEAELIADRVRLARLAGDEDEAGALGLRLEEGFPDSPWLARVRGDLDPDGWGEPWRSLPPAPPRGEMVPDAPTAGPWGRLLFGEDLLSRTLADLEREVPQLEAPPPPEPLAEDAAPVSARVPSLPVIFAGIGGGAPVALLAEAAVGDPRGPVRYRAGFGRVLAGRRNNLPESARFGWEAALGIRPGSWRFDLTARGDGRDDDLAPELGLHEHDVDADWRGIRLDAGLRGEDGSQAGLFASRSRGDLDAGSGDHTRSDQTWLGGKGVWRRDRIRWRGSFAAAALDHRTPDFGEFRFWFRDLRLVREVPGRWYVGVRAAMYDGRGLLMPVAGVERGLGSGWMAWAGSEPSLQLPSFREVFVTNGDWQRPDLTLPAERRNLDLRGGLRWRTAGADAEVQGELFRVGHLRTWERDGGLWQERALDEATGSRLRFSANGALGGFELNAGASVQRIEADGRRVPFTPRAVTTLELGYALRGWRWVVTAQGVEGRVDEDGAGYGTYLRWNLETAYRWRVGELPLGARWLELWLRVENLADADDPRWPGIPGSGAGVYGGVQALYGD